VASEAPMGSACSSKTGTKASSATKVGETKVESFEGGAAWATHAKTSSTTALFEKREDVAGGAKKAPPQNSGSSKAVTGIAATSSSNVGGASEADVRAADALLMDADDEIEIICEGSMKGDARGDAAPAAVAAFGAKGQEALVEDELPAWKQQQQSPSMQVQKTTSWIHGTSPQKTSPVVKPELTQKQKEEAAKAAELRKKFDNQKFIAQQHAVESPKFTGCVPVAASERNVKKEAPGADPALVLGLNVSALELDLGQGRFDEECLPGGIEFELPRARTQAEEDIRAKRNKNKHEDFDQDDEMLMQDILDAANT